MHLLHPYQRRPCLIYHKMLRRHFFSSLLRCVERECHFFMMPHLLDIIAYCLFSCQNEQRRSEVATNSYTANIYSQFTVISCVTFPTVIWQWLLQPLAVHMTLTYIEEYSLRLNNVLDCIIYNQITVRNVRLPKAVLSTVKIFAVQEYTNGLKAQTFAALLTTGSYSSLLFKESSDDLTLYIVFV